MILSEIRRLPHRLFVMTPAGTQQPAAVNIVSYIQDGRKGIFRGSGRRSDLFYNSSAADSKSPSSAATIAGMAMRTP